MKCAQHYEADAVGTCVTCGKGLCPTCADMFSKPYCERCVVQVNRSAVQHNEGLIRKAKRSLLVPAVLLPVALWTLSSLGTARNLNSFINTLIMSAAVATTPAGWSFLSRYFEPSGGYFHIFARWLNAGFHLALSVVLGMVVGP